MTDLQLILVILGTFFALYQLCIMGMGIAMLVNGKFTSVKIGWGTGLISAALFIAAVLV